MARKKTEIVSEPRIESAANDAMPSAVETSKKPCSFFRFLISCLIVNVVMIGMLAGLVYAKREVASARIQSWLAASMPGENNGLLAEVATLTSRLSLMEQRLAAEEASLRTLQASLANTTPTGNTASQTLADNQKIREIETSIAELKQAISSTDIQSLREQLQQITLLQQGLSQQVQQQAAHTPPDLRLVALFQSLRSKALEGEPFQDSLQRFLATAQPYPALVEVVEPLEIYAASGRPDLTELQRALQTSIKEYLREKEGVDHSFSAKIRHNIADFITIRKLSDSGDSPLASINRAEASANLGKMEQAVAALDDLPADVAPFFSAWREEAKGYYHIPRLLQKLDQRIADVVMQASSGAPHAP